MEKDKDYALEKRDYLINKYQDNSMNLSKLIITLSTGSIVFSASLIRNAERVFRCWIILSLVSCWISLVISIVLGVLFLRKVLEEMKREAEMQDEFFMHHEEGATSKAVELYNEILPNVRKSEKKYFNWQFYAFLLGLILLGIHCIIRLIS